ncbi:hypothetical protein [Georgenia sp. SYP-B2076]|uniref:hypothetical protein n=1 Tax=Georgenia sp. SYP-B2076 TaxID=2495881 RepID=UPI000F8C42F6|nr:hypothetical protein [Georgenia sp. SYP-B2076]
MSEEHRAGQPLAGRSARRHRRMAGHGGAGTGDESYQDRTGDDAHPGGTGDESHIGGTADDSHLPGTGNEPQPFGGDAASPSGPTPQAPVTGPRHAAPGPVDQPPPAGPGHASPPGAAAGRAQSTTAEPPEARVAPVSWAANTEPLAAPPVTPAPPPRPEIANRFPAPIQQHVTPTTTLRVSRALWLLSFASGLAAAAFAFLVRVDQHTRLLDQVTALDPSRDAETLDKVATIVFWGAIGAVVLVIAIEALLMRSMMRGRGSARVGLFVMVVVHVVVAILAESFLAAPGTAGGAVRWPLVAQLLLACAALVTSLLPGANAWFRAVQGRRTASSGGF